MALKHIGQIVAGVVADTTAARNGWLITKIPAQGARFLLRQPGQPAYALQVSVVPALLGGLRLEIDPPLPDRADKCLFLRVGECRRLLPQIEVCRRSQRHLAFHAAGRDWVLRQPTPEPPKGEP
jgi:hypothetical protein